jgi:peroxiredoxin
MTKIKKMTATITLLIMITVLMIGSLSTNSFAIEKKKGDIAPGFTMRDIYGKEVSLADYKGKVVFITFWATWCAKCWEEIDFTMKSIERSDDLVVLLINMESQSSSPAHLKKIIKAVEELKIKDPVLLDMRLQAYRDYEISSLPSTAIIDKNGIIQFSGTHFYQEKRDQINETIKELTAK